MTVVAGREPVSTDGNDGPDRMADDDGPDAAARRARRRTERRRSLLWGGAAVGIVVLTALVAALSTPPTTRGDLEPTSAAPTGSRAVAEILKRQGVEVRTVRRSTDVAALADADATTTVVVHPELLGPDQLDRLRRAPGRLVLVDADLPTLDVLAPFARVAGTVEPHPAEPGCDEPAAVAAGSVRAGGNLYRLAAADGAAPTPASGPALLCYREPTGDRGSLVVGTDAGRRVVVLGQADVLRNEFLAAEGDAALALRLLGGTRMLVWYLPDPLERGTSDDGPTITELMPPWVRWVAVQLVLVVGLVMLWRGRRLGRLVAEPLPVVVRASETQEGRARLYRRAKAYDRASATLRTAALRRLARRLDVPADAAPDVVVALAADTTGLPQPAIRATFLGPAPTDDRGLVRLADEIALVERAVTDVATLHRTRPTSEEGHR